MHDKQKIFEAFCEYYTDPLEKESPGSWYEEMRIQNLRTQFEFLYEFFTAHLQEKSPGSP